MAVHDVMWLHTTSDKYIIESVEQAGDNELLVIDRVSQEITLKVAKEGEIPSTAVTKTIFGIFGVIRLLAGPYLVVISARTKIGEINGHSIWRATGTDILPYKRTTLHLTEQQVQDNKVYLSMIETVLSTEGHYFSTTYDVTHTLQRLYNTSPDFLQIPLHERADQRFVWNGHMLKEFSQQLELSRYCMPIMHGFLCIKSCSVNSKPFQYILFSRRSCFRAGTRYYMRGLDSEGHAANFVETEQIIERDGTRCSFVQTRGSVPLYWSQRPNLKYKPDPIISSSQDHTGGFGRHFDTQVYNYGRQVLINLLDQKGEEQKLTQAFSNTVTSSHSNHIKYVIFDFHNECRRLRWDRLHILIEKLEESLKEFGYFMASQDGMVIMVQEGVFRTNCIDCLDRTNVVQSMIARRILHEQLMKLGILEEGQKAEDHTDFEFMLRNVWADNADVCAKQYAGTGALKTDFTRMGKRTFAGLLQDGVNAVVRYFRNNFADGYRQDAIDLYLGNHVVENDDPSPIHPQNDWRFYLLPVIFLIAFSMMVISILVPDDHVGEQVMYVLFWGTASAISFALIYYYGSEFVDQPKLAQAKSKTE